MTEAEDTRDLALELFEMDQTGAIDMDTWPAAKKVVERHTSTPFAGCRSCGEPLVSTFEWRGYEFICMGCGRHWAFLQPRPIPFSLEVTRRHDELRAQYDVERKERAEARERFAQPTTEKENH